MTAAMALSGRTFRGNSGDIMPTETRNFLFRSNANEKRDFSGRGLGSE